MSNLIIELYNSKCSTFPPSVPRGRPRPGEILTQLNTYNSTEQKSER